MADDLTLGSANVVTMSDPDRAGAVTVSGGLIASVGETTSAAVDLEGATVLPGFIDSHSHWLGDSDMVGNTKPMAIAAALAAGWTSISEMFVSDERLEELCALELAGDLRVKVGAFLPVNYQLQRFGHPYEAFEPGQVLGSTLFLQGVKLFTDGADDGLGYQTKPPNPAVQGTLFWKGDDLANEIVAADQAGWQVAVHATGDAGLDALLEAYEQLGREAILEGRHRIEHLTTVRDDQVGRIAALGLIASIQHSWFHGDTAETLTRWVGRDRVSFTGRWRDFVDAGIPLTGGTDHPWSIAGEVGDSIAAIAHATTRVGTSGKPPPAWMASQRLTVWEVLRSLTVDAAYAQGTEESMGTIEVGKAGDLVILSADPTQVPPGELASIKVLATIVDGHVEYCADTVPDDLRPRCPA
ncbi:MAG TPA: amidohydrolase family protein [Nocardioidaceae bacterium]|nr:amidohydrolase family protein [Nocardioidaceae bacterium]